MATITTTNAKRHSYWLRIFGRDDLPVKSEQPRIQSHPTTYQSIVAYDLDVSRLHPMARARFAHQLKWRHRIPFEDAWALTDGYAIDAEDCEVVSDEMLPRFSLPKVNYA